MTSSLYLSKGWHFGSYTNWRYNSIILLNSMNSSWCIISWIRVAASQSSRSMRQEAVNDTPGKQHPHTSSFWVIKEYKPLRYTILIWKITSNLDEGQKFPCYNLVLAFLALARWMVEMRWICLYSPKYQQRWPKTVTSPSKVQIFLAKPHLARWRGLAISQGYLEGLSVQIEELAAGKNIFT